MEKLSYLPQNHKAKGLKRLPYLINRDVVSSHLSCHLLWWFLRWIHPLLRQVKTILGNKHSLCWGNGCQKHYGHQQVKEVVFLLLWLVMTGVFGSLVGMETSKEKEVLHKLRGTSASASKK